MNLVLLSIVVLCILVGIVALVFRPYDYGAGVQRIRKFDAGNVKEDAEDNTRWRSVRIRPGLISCALASGMSDQVFLAKEAPELPLSHCKEKECRCHYIFLDDRRSGLDRRDDLEKLNDFFPTASIDRRQLPGRRVADLAA